MRKAVAHAGQWDWKRTLDSQVPAKKALGHVHVLDLHLNVVHLTVRLLGSFEFAAGP